jgi:ATP-binding cassette subfamily B protein
MVMYFLAFQRGLAFLRELLGGFANVYEDNLFVSNIYEFLNLKPKIVDVSKKKVLEFNFNKLIEFKNVAFAYPNSERNVFSNINLKIPYGKTIAIVGKNGIGKTTLIKLLCRLYDVNNGQILIDGIDIKNFNQTQLRKNISVIFQDFVLYNMSAEDNIWFGDITKTKNENDIRKAALDAGVDEVLSNLNNGYKTILGNLFDDSEELSIGEWQKIALARAFFKNANLLVLDEPTSAIDADTEFELFQKFKKITVGKTVIIISHRFSTVKLSDYIYVLGNEQIIEEGTHQELMKNNSFYAKMFNQQAQNFSNIL